MFQFYWPYLALLLPLPYIVLKLFAKGRSQSDENSTQLFFPQVERIKALFPTVTRQKPKGTRAFLTWLSLAWVGLVLAFMQPEKVDQFKQVKNEGYDLMLAVDISSSMQAIDFSSKTKILSRLDVIKDVVGEFVLGRAGDRVGLVTFGEKAYLQAPLTLDTLSVSKMLMGSVTGMAGNATAIGDAIGMSVKTLRDRPAGSRVLVLLTDGEDNASSIPPIEAAKLAKQYGIRIYTVGVGRSGPVPFPSNFGGYTMVEVPFDEELLKQVSSMTGGQSFMASDQKALQEIYGKINELEKTESNQMIFFIRDPLYQYPLAFSMMCLFVLGALTLKRKEASVGS